MANERYKAAYKKFRAAVDKYFIDDREQLDLEALMLASYELSTLIRIDYLDGISDYKLTSEVEPIEAMINECLTVVSEDLKFPFPSANVLEILSRSAYNELRKGYY